MGYYNSILDLIGNTPIVKFNKYMEKFNLGTEIYGKIESLSPGGSVKDRTALALIEDAEKKGLINENTHIIEATSGNFGISLAYICAIKNIKLTLVMPEIMSIERRRIIIALGTKLVLSDPDKGITAALEKAEELLLKTEGSISLDQFKNQANPKIHEETTAKEILSDLPDVDIVVAGAGTGGTVTGIARGLKEVNPNVKICTVEPANSSVLLGGKPGPHIIAGIGTGFIPNTLDMDVIDEVIPVTNIEAIETVKDVARCEGILIGISSGAAVFAAKSLASLASNTDKKILVILPDSGERYLSTGIYD